MGMCLSSPNAAGGGEQARAPRELKPWQDPAKVNLAEKYLGATCPVPFSSDNLIHMRAPGLAGCLHTLSLLSALTITRSGGGSDMLPVAASPRLARACLGRQ
jgi:hypothetical protein